MLDRILLTVALIAGTLALPAFAGGGGVATFDESRRLLLAESLPDETSAFAAEMTEIRKERQALQDSEARTAERKLEKLDETIKEMQTTYKEAVKKETTGLEETLEKLGAKRDKLYERWEETKDETTQKRIDEEIRTIKREFDFLSLKKSIIEAYGGYGVESKQELPESMMGNKAPDFRLSAPAGDDRSMETASTAPILIIVFFSAQNRGSAAFVAAMYNTYRSNTNVDVLAIAVGDTTESYTKARLTGMNRVKVLLDPDGALAMKYKVGFAPQTAVLDRERQVHHVSVGDSSAARSGTAKAVRALQDALAER
jgi:peroxiredoxin/flagellar motility protein MotE (MotC chaperone)